LNKIKIKKNTPKKPQNPKNPQLPKPGSLQWTQKSIVSFLKKIPNKR